MDPQAAADTSSIAEFFVIALWFGETASQTIDVFKEIRGYVLPKWVKDKLYTFPSSHLCCWNKICIARHEYDDIGLSLEGDRRDIEPNPHIDPLLTEGWGKVVIS